MTIGEDTGEHVTVLVHPEEWDDTLQYDKTTRRMVPTVAVGRPITLELFLDAHPLRSFGFHLYDHEPKNSAPYVSELAPDSVLTKFGGRVVQIDTTPPYPTTDQILGGLTGLSATLDCGLPVHLSGRFGKEDTLFQIAGKWIEGLSILWGVSLSGTRNRHEETNEKGVFATVVSLKEYPPVQLGGQPRVFRALSLMVAARISKP